MDHYWTILAVMQCLPFLLLLYTDRFISISYSIKDFSIHTKLAYASLAILMPDNLSILCFSVVFISRGADPGGPDRVIGLCPGYGGLLPELPIGEVIFNAW